MKKPSKKVKLNLPFNIQNSEAVKNGARFSYEYIKKEGKAHFILFGGTSLIINTLKLIYFKLQAIILSAAFYIKI